MRCLVVGGSGFIGAHLVDRLLKSGHSVRVYGRSLNRFRSMPEQVEYMRGELGDYPLIREAVQGMEVVYHLVSTTTPRTSNEDPAYDVRSNLIDTLRLLEASVESGVRKVIFTSSGGTVYGPANTLPVTERHPTNPISSYGIVKLAIEKYLDLFHRINGLDYMVLRVANPYGPYQDPFKEHGVISVFLYHVYTGRTIKIWGDGGVIRDYIYVSDLVEALERAAEVNSCGRVINAGSGHGVSLRELLEVISNVAGKLPLVEYLPAKEADVPAVTLDISMAREELGWNPEIGLTEGMARTWDWIRTLPR